MGCKTNWRGPVLLAAVSLALVLPAAGAQSGKLHGAPRAAAASSPGATPPGSSESPSGAAEFELGVGDVIHISVWHEPELTGTAVVRPDGRVSLPLAGEVAVAGKTASGSEALIRSLLMKYVTDPQVTVSVVEIHSRQVFITGQVQRPGAYPLIGSCNVLQLIATAGGLTPYAHRKRIVVLDANNNPVARFDYNSAIKGDARQTRDLSPGETVVVP